MTTRLTGVAFDLLAGSDIFANTRPAGWDFDEATGTLPGEGNAFDACFYSGSNCGAGGSGGLTNATGWLAGFSVSFTLGGYANAAAVQDALFAGYTDGTLAACVRVISIGETGPGSDVACEGTPVSVPEPATAALLGLGLLGVGWGMRRRQV